MNAVTKARIPKCTWPIAMLSALFLFQHSAMAQEGESGTANGLQKLQFNNPELVVDLGVGLWAQPLPMDYDGDGDYDLVVATNDVPSNGIYFFENPAGNVPEPVFKPGVRIGDAQHNITVSYVEGEAVIATPRQVYPRFRDTALADAAPLPVDVLVPFNRTRANQWRFADYDSDGDYDVVIGLGVWDDYGWDDAYDDEGNWLNGPLHGYVYVAERDGDTDTLARAVRLETTKGPVDVFGAPSPNFADWDGDGDMDLICGSFLDSLTYFENIGNPGEPQYAPGRMLERDGQALRMDLQMLQVVGLDWDGDGDTDLIVGQEDGRVAWLECDGDVRDGLPQFQAPRFFKQQADAVKVGALCTPFGTDWDGDGDEDLIVGDTAGYVSFVENLDGGDPPIWAAPVYLEAGGETIRIQAGRNGSIQGPAEAKWGYTVPAVADWNHDGLPDIVINSIWGRVLWYENAGTRATPLLKSAQPVQVAWEGAPPKPEWLWWTPEPGTLVTQWRTSPVVIDLNEDGLNDLVMLDHEGYLTFFERERTAGGLVLLPGKRIFRDENGDALRLNDGWAGKSGRRKLCLVDWDGDGRLDILINSRSIDFLRNIADEPGAFVFRNEGPVTEHRLAGHTTCPATVDWDRNGVPDLLIGAEDGFLYYMKNPRSGPGS